MPFSDIIYLVEACYDEYEYAIIYDMAITYRAWVDSLPETAERP